MRYNIQSSNINFLYGSGLSSPYLEMLGAVEQRLTELSKKSGISEEIRMIVGTSIKKAYFDRCISKNSTLLDGDANARAVFGNYQSWFQTLNEILVNRRSTLLGKQINLFTTNMDIFSELALESIGVEYNDGFLGSLKPVYSTGNFKKSVWKTSQQYGVATELPVFNLLKIHGSVTWKLLENGRLGLDRTLQLLREIDSLNIPDDKFLKVFEVNGDREAIKLVDELVADAKELTYSEEIDSFEKLYARLIMVNPTKDKYRLTTLDQTYYDLLRIFANELERENTILFVMGFSFADEHIAEITMRAARSNPTLKIFICAHSAGAEAEIRTNIEKCARGSISPNVIFIPRESEKLTSGDNIELPHNLENIVTHIFGKLAKETRGRNR